MIKYKFSWIPGAIALVSVMLFSCEKKLGRENAQENFDFSDRAYVQIYNGILNSTRNYYYVDGTPLNGAGNAYNAVFPGSAPANVNVGQGFRAFLVRDTLATTTQIPMSFAEILQPRTYYTVYLYDTLTTPKQKIVINNIEVPTDTTARIKFANFVFSRTAVPNVDIFSTNRNANIFTNVAITQVTDYIPYASNTADILQVRETGTTNQLATLSINLAGKRSYTLVFRGRYQTTGTTGVARLLTLVTNY